MVITGYLLTKRGHISWQLSLFQRMLNGTAAKQELLFQNTSFWHGGDSFLTSFPTLILHVCELLLQRATHLLNFKGLVFIEVLMVLMYYLFYFDNLSNSLA